MVGIPLVGLDVRRELRGERAGVFDDAVAESEQRRVWAHAAVDCSVGVSACDGLGVMETSDRIRGKRKEKRTQYNTVSQLTLLQACNSTPLPGSASAPHLVHRCRGGLASMSAMDRRVGGSRGLGYAGFTRNVVPRGVCVLGVKWEYLAYPHCQTQRPTPVNNNRSPGRCAVSEK